MLKLQSTRRALLRHLILYAHILHLLSLLEIENTFVLVFQRQAVDVMHPQVNTQWNGFHTALKDLSTRFKTPSVTCIIHETVRPWVRPHANARIPERVFKRVPYWSTATQPVRIAAAFRFRMISTTGRDSKHLPCLQ